MVVADWDEEPRRVRFREKRTFDAGATPDLDGGDRPELRSPDASLLAALDAAGTDDASTGDSEAEAENASDDEDSKPTDDDRRERAARSSVSEEQGGPLWELGQLVTYLVAATVGAVVGACRWTARACLQLVGGGRKGDGGDIDAEKSDS